MMGGATPPPPWGRISELASLIAAAETFMEEEYEEGEYVPDHRDFAAAEYGRIELMKELVAALKETI